MAGEIALTPEDMRNAAIFMRTQLETITGEMRDLKSRVDEVANSTWKGNAKEKYVPMFDETYSNVLQALTESINGLSKGLDATVDAFEQTDDGLAVGYGGG